MAKVISMTSNHLSKNLIFIRTEFGFSQVKVAELLNVKRSTYAGWEEGRNEPSIDTLIEISKLYSITLDQLIKPL